MAFYKVQVAPKFKFKAGPGSEEYLIIKPGPEPQITEAVHWPNRCPCCGGESDTHTEITYSVRRPGPTGGIAETTHTIPVPYCQACLNHVKSWSRGMWVAGGTGILIFVILGAMAIQTAMNGSSPWAIVALFALGAIGGYLAGWAVYKVYNSRVVSPMLHEKCRSPQAAVIPGGVGEHGHIFLFRQKDYADEFARLNGAENV